jgi:pimeloyl-ACP methyl ester carboxylesterase
MVAVRAIEDGSLVQATREDMLLKERTFLRTHIGLIGEDVGASIGGMLARIEPSVQVVVLVAPPGPSVTQWAWSARDADKFSTIASDLGIDLDSTDLAKDDPAFWPGLAIHQTLFDRADPLAHAAALRRAAVNVLVLMALDDEVVPNRSSEGYAASLGTTLVGSDARFVGDLKRTDASDDAGGNYLASGSRVTRTTYVYAPATHDFLQERIDSQFYEHPPEPPFEQLPQSVTVQNPTSAAVKQIAQYLESFFACVDVGSYLPNTACPAQSQSP